MAMASPVVSKCSPGGIAANQERHGSKIISGRPRRCVGWLHLCGGKAMPLKDVVGEGEQEHHSGNLFKASHGDLLEVPVAPAGVDAFADRAALVLQLALLAGHPGAPRQHARTIVAARLERVGAMLGLRGRTVDLDLL